MYEYLRWMIGQEAHVWLRHTLETVILDGTIKDVNETALMLHYEGDEWAITLDCIVFVKIQGITEK